MGNLSKYRIKFYIWDNRLRSCTQFSPRGKCAPGAYLLHWICITWKGRAIRTRMQFCTRCIFIKHRFHDQNTPQVLIYTPCVYLHLGANCAYKRGTTISFSRIWLAVDLLRPKLCEISIQICYLKNWTRVTFNYFMHDPVFEHSDTHTFICFTGLHHYAYQWQIIQG